MGLFKRKTKIIEQKPETKEITLKSAFDPIPMELVDGVAQSFALSGFFKTAKDFHKAKVKIMAGRELGLPPFASMQGIHIIENTGNLQIGYVALLGIFTQHGIDYQYIEKSDRMCSMKFTYKGKTYDENYTIAQAQKANLMKKDTWQKSPMNMLVARTVSNAAKFYFPFVFNGVSIYTEGDDFGNQTETIIEARTPEQEADAKQRYNDAKPSFFDVPADLEAERLRIYDSLNGHLAEFLDTHKIEVDKAKAGLKKGRKDNDWAEAYLTLDFVRIASEEFLRLKNGISEEPASTGEVPQGTWPGAIPAQP